MYTPEALLTNLEYITDVSAYPSLLSDHLRHHAV